MKTNLAAWSLAAVLSLPLTAHAQFVEEEVNVLNLFEGAFAGDIFGWVCATMDDIDGDGVRELLIPALVGGLNGGGEVTVYSGATGTPLNVVEGGFFHGYSVSDAGDVNGDGFADYIVGGIPVAVYSGADHSVLLQLEAVTGFGWAVAGAGDLDGDGHDDVLVGSKRIAGVSEAGRGFAFSGATGALLWQVDGVEGANLGAAAGSLGDVNADGVPDVVFGADNAGPNAGGEAYVYSGADGSLIWTLTPNDPTQAVVFGQFFASGAGDVDGDGIGDAFVGDYAALGGAGESYIFSGRTGEVVHRFSGLDPDDGFGPGRGAPDVNGDGHDDIFIGAYTDGDGAPGAGKAYLYSGRSGALLRTITATVAGDQFGVDAISTGDTDGDGLTDYLVTAVGLSFAGVDTGRAYLIAGAPLPCVADLNGNGWVGFLDLVKLLKFSKKADLRGDLNGDRVVDDADFHVLFADLGRCTSE